ncbi:MAG: tetratricopeptide repeat protein [Candidatus Thorarchaeota archaeon]
MPEELVRAEQLMYVGKEEQALTIITNFENKKDLTPEEQLSSLILKGRNSFFNEKFNYSRGNGELAYQLSQEQGKIYESVEALILMAAERVWDSNFDGAKDLIMEAEKLCSSLTDIPSSEISKLKANLLEVECWLYLYKNDYKKALEIATECLTLWEMIENKVGVINMHQLFGFAHLMLGQYDIALDYASKCLSLAKELNFQTLIAASFTLIAGIHLYSGNINQSLEYCKKASSIKEVDRRHKLFIFIFLGRIYQEKGELDRSLRYLKQAVPLAEKMNNIDQLILIIGNIGSIYRMKNDYSHAEEYLIRSLTLSEKIGFSFVQLISVFSLYLLNLENNFYNKSHQYLERYKELAAQSESKLITQGGLIAKALELKKSDRRRNRAEAEKLLQQVVEDEIVYPSLHTYSLISLCDLLLEELSIYNNPEILEELNSLIKRLLDFAEKQRSYPGLAEGKLLQAKLALIEMNFESAKKLLTEAQRVAEIRGLNLLAQRISSEHDSLLEKVDEWDKLKKKDAPMADRIELASFDGVINRLQGTQAIDPPELVNEEPILLIIMDNSGVTYFNHPFMANWDHSDLFSSFMSAFNTFSSEIFSKSIDRIRVGENTILINPIESFLTCYVIKGQSYPALQKLTRFTEAIRANTEIWQALNKSVKTSEMLELNKPSALKTVIDEIFTH